MRLDHLEALNAARRSRIAVATVTDLETGTVELVRADAPQSGALREDLSEMFQSGKSGMLTLEGRSWFVNVYLPAPRLLIIGAVHISQVLAPMAAMANFSVTIIDPRTAFATPERFAGVELLAEWPDDALKQRPLDEHSALVAVTHDPKIDDPALLAAFGARCFYIGALGSRKTHAARVSRLTAAGISATDIARISAPIGLDIGAANPPEIAVAILADVIRHMRQREVIEREVAGA